ncbi:MAG TPA: hypothetical protein VM910_04930 [Bradyrhizobium sp.]|nr:hypothetical protein [Bradyrhizobium sp.]
MKYFLNHISPTPAAIARALVSYAEEIRMIERVLRQLYPAEPPPEDPLLFAAILAVHAMTFGVCAAEDRQREIEARAEKHVEHTRKLAEAITKSDKPKLQ